MLHHLVASPTLVSIGGVPYFAARFRLGDFGLLLSEGGLALGRDARWGDDDFRAWLMGDGSTLLLWCVLRRDNAVTLAAADAIEATPEELAEVARAAMRRRATAIPRTGGDDVAELRWGQTIKSLRSAGLNYAEIAELTLDQIHLEGSRPEASDPEADARERAVLDEMERLHREKWAAGPPPEGVAPDVAAGLAALNLTIVEET